MSEEELAAWKEYYRALVKSKVTCVDIERRLGRKPTRALHKIWGAIQRQKSPVLRAVAFNDTEAEFVSIVARRAGLAIAAPTPVRERRLQKAALALAWLGLRLSEVKRGQGSFE
jgi:hypothetical protein